MIVVCYYFYELINQWVFFGGVGMMGYGLLVVFGVKFVQFEREVVVFIGDGGFQMIIQELGFCV